jgi:hypothetical protein
VQQEELSFTSKNAQMACTIPTQPNLLALSHIK